MISTPNNLKKTFPFPVPEYRFDQRNEVFKRRIWDDRIRVHADRFYQEVKFQDKYGYRKLDYALRNAAWHIEYGYAQGNMKGNHGLFSWDFVPPKMKRFVEAGEKITLSKEENTRIIKKAARFLGADLAGICYAHPNLIYSHEMDLTEDRHHPISLPDGAVHTVVMAVEMDYESCRYSPDAVSGASTGLGYSDQAVVAGAVAMFIRGLGYRAIPSGNDTSLSIPLAMAAGLGELGRSGLLITEKYGPRVRICKVFTDLPLEHDTYRTFGVEEFCRVCKKCAKRCPSQAIPHGDQTDVGPSPVSSFSGVKKWYIDPEKCFGFWSSNRIDCNTCVASCPFNKKTGRLHDVVRLGIRGRLPLMNRLFLRFDDLFGYGKTLNSDEKNFWER